MDEKGSVVAAYDYRPYGGILASSGTEQTRFRFTGHERDDESGLDYMLERSYDYGIGRFLRPDPMQDEYPGLSPYVYAANNPLKYVDPDGRIIKLSSGLSAAQKTRLQGYLANLQKSRTGKAIYDFVHGEKQVFVLGFADLSGETDGSVVKYGDARIKFEFVQDPETKQVLEAKVIGGNLYIDEDKILGTPGKTIEGTLGHEIYHAAQAIRDPVKSADTRNKQEIEQDAKVIQADIERELARQRRKDEEYGQGG